MTNKIKIVFITFGKGSGDLIVGTSIFLGLKRAGVNADFTALTNCEFCYLVTPYHSHVSINPEPEKFLKHDRLTELYKTLELISPDLIIVYGVWFPLFMILDDFRAKKIFITRQISDRWFKVPIVHGEFIEFSPDQYDKCFSIEPGFFFRGCENINPVIIRNRNEIFSRKKARELLKVNHDKKLAIVSQNGYLGELKELIDLNRESLDDYEVITTTNRKTGSVFPLADYANAIDLLISGAGYSTFYETRYFDIRSKLVPFKRNAEDTSWRLKTNSDYTFDINGADQIAEYIINDN